MNDTVKSDREFAEEIIALLRGSMRALDRGPLEDTRRRLSSDLRRLLDERPAILDYNGMCPILIVVAGLWSSNYRNARLYGNRFHQNSAEFYEEALNELFVRGADPDIRHENRHRSSALHWLVAWDRPHEGRRFIDLMDQHGIRWNANIEDATGNTALGLLIARKYFGRTERVEQEDAALVERLIDSGTDLAIQNAFGNTAVHYAFMKRDVATVRTLTDRDLLNEGLLSATNDQGETAADVYRLEYEDVGARIRAVYDAASAEHIICRIRWERDCDVFREMFGA